MLRKAHERAQAVVARLRSYLRAGVWGLGFGVWGLGFGVCVGFEVWGLGCGVWGLGFGVWGLVSGGSIQGERVRAHTQPRVGFVLRGSCDGLGFPCSGSEMSSCQVWFLWC